MAQEDKIKREIDRIGLVLAKILGILLNKNNHHDEAVKDVVVQTQNELDIDLPVLLAMDHDDSIELLIKEKGFSNDHLKLFADLLYETAGNSTGSAQQALLRTKALAIYQYVQANANGTMYLDVIYRIKELASSSHWLLNPKTG